MSIVLKGVEGAMRGYRPQVDWGGEEGPATIKVGSHNVRVGTAGWRRRCLFTLLSALLILSVLNIILTLWLLRRIMLGPEGLGALKILRGGVELDGISRMDHDLTVAQIQGQTSEDLSILGFYNISLTLMEGRDSVSDLVLDSRGLRSRSRGFRVKSPQGSLLFESKDRNMATDAQFFTVTGNEGADFLGSLGTPRIEGGDVHEFRLESSTRSVIGSAGNLVRIEARDGDVTVTSIGDITLTSSTGGKFRFESPNVFFSNLLSSEDIESVAPTTQPTETQISSPVDGAVKDGSKEETQTSLGAANSEEEAVQVFQVCVCPSGMLFLVSSESLCIPDKWTCK